MAKNSSFDLDFGYGRKGELLVEELLTGGKTVEVKRDRKWWIDRKSTRLNSSH